MITLRGVAIFVFAAACGSKGSTIDRDGLVAKTKACKDEACLKNVEHEMVAGHISDKPSDDDVKRVTEIVSAIDAKRRELAPKAPTATPPTTTGAARPADHLSRVELFEAMFIACRTTFVLSNLDAKSAALMESKAKQLDADAAKLGATIPPPVVATGKAITDKSAKLMRVMGITQAFVKAMQPTYPPTDLALVSLGADACMLWAVYHPDDQMMATYVSMVEKHGRIAGLDPATTTKPLLDTVAKNPPNIDEASLAFVDAVEKAIGP